MRLALLGSDPDAYVLSAEIARSDHHDLVAVFDADDLYQSLSDLAPQAVWNDSWESLLHGTVADAVIVARSGADDARADRLRKLVQAAVPMLLVHPICESIVCYELDMIRRDSQCVMVPFFPDMLHPAVSMLSEMVRGQPESTLGRLQQVTIQRRLVDHSQNQVFVQLSRDVQLARLLVGEVVKVAAMGSMDERSVFQNLGVQMTTEAGHLISWSLEPSDSNTEANVWLHGADSAAHLSMSAPDKPWTLQIEGSGQPRETIAPASPGTALARLHDAISGQTVDPDWIDACRDAEILDAVTDSLRRGRNIDMRLDEPSEHSTFKGIMAALGCGLMLTTGVVLLLVLIVEGLRLPFRDSIVWGIWPLYVLAPLVIFLLLQFLKLVFPQQSPPDD